MNSFQIAFSVVGPLIVYMLVGYLIRWSGIATADNFKALNQILFRVFIPLSLFFSIYRAELGTTVRPGLFVLIEVLLISTAVLSWVIIHRFVKDRKDCATITQGIFRSNFVLFGGLVASSLCDEAGVALIAALCCVVVPTVNIEGVVLFELVRGGKVRPGDLLLRILKNPLVIAGILGIFCSLLHLQLPRVIEDPLSKLGNAATPVAMVTLGGLLSFGSIRRHKAYLMASVMGKLVIIPLVMLMIALLLGYRGNEIVAFLAVFGSPTAVASAPMAQAMGGNGDLAGEIVAATSVVSLLTIFLLVFGLSGLGFI